MLFFLKGLGGPVMADQSLYIVNYGSTDLEAVVASQSAENLKVVVGPKSFVTVNAQAVTGGLPWLVKSSSSPATVRSLPAILASFHPNVLTAPAYPTS